MSTSDYTRVATGLAWLSEHLPSLDGLGIVAVTVTPHQVQIQVDTHEEASALADELALVGLDFEKQDSGDGHLAFIAAHVIDVTGDDDWYDRLTVQVGSYVDLAGGESR